MKMVKYKIAMTPRHKQLYGNFSAKCYGFPHKKKTTQTHTKKRQINEHRRRRLLRAVGLYPSWTYGVRPALRPVVPPVRLCETVRRVCETVRRVCETVRVCAQTKNENRPAPFCNRRENHVVVVELRGVIGLSLLIHISIGPRSVGLVW